MTVTKPQNTTLIDSMSEGYRAINRRPWVLLVPILLNLYLWLGAPLSFAPLFESFYHLLQPLHSNPVDQEQVQVIYNQLLLYNQQDLRPQLAFLNLVPILSQNVPMPIDTQASNIIQVSNIGGAVLAFIVLNFSALIISSIFIAQLGAAVQRQWLPAGGLRLAAKVGLSLIGAMALLFGVALILGLPLLFFTVLMFYINQTLGLFVIELLAVLVFWVSIYIGFYPEAIVIGQQGPLRAIYTSFHVVRHNFWGTLGLLALSLIISLGTGVIWRQLINSTLGAIIAIVASAYIGSGLLAARMAFFRERLLRWQSNAHAQHPTRTKMTL